MFTDEQLDKVMASRQEHLDKLFDLIAKSEERIDRTNEMICKLAETCKHNHDILSSITQEYSKHLDSLTLCRNTLVEQNSTLLRMHETDMHEISMMRKELRDNTDRLYNLICKLSQPIKIDNNLK